MFTHGDHVAEVDRADCLAPLPLDLDTVVEDKVPLANTVGRHRPRTDDAYLNRRRIVSQFLALLVENGGVVE